MPLAKLKGLQARLLVIVLLAMLPVLFLALYLAVQDYRDAKAAAIESCKRLTRGYVSAASGTALLERAKLILSEIAALPGMDDLDPQACARVLGSIEPGHASFSHIDMLRPDGTLACGSAAHRGNMNFRRQEWFQAALKAGGLVVGSYQKDAAGSPVLPLALAVRSPAGQVRVVFSMGLRLESLADLLDDQPLPEGAAVSLIDRSGTILARFPKTAEAVGQGAPGAARFLPELLASGQDTWQATGVDGVERIYFISPLFEREDRALFLRMGLPADVAFAQANRTLARNLTFLGSMAALVLAAAWFFSNSLVLRHIKNIWLATRKLAEGNYAYRIGATGGGELGELALAFDHMAGVLEHRTAQLTAAEQSYRDIFELSVTGIFQSSIAGRLQIANQSLADMLGFRCPEELTSRVGDVGSQIYADPEHRRIVLSCLERNGTLSGFEFPAKRADGGVVWLSLNARGIHDVNGRLVGTEGMVTDITLRKTVEQELKSKQENLQALLDHSPALISVKDAQGRYVLSNRMHQDIHNLGSDVVGQSLESLFPPDEARRIREEDRQVLAAGKSLTFQRPLPTKTGRRHFMSVKFPLYDEESRTNRVCSISYDVTDLEQIREALRQSEEKYRAMIQTSPDLIWLIDPGGRLVEVNSASRELIGYDPEELRGRHFHQFFHHDDVQAHDRELVLPQFLGRRAGRQAAPGLINERRQPPRSTRNLNLRLIPKGGDDASADQRSFELSSCGLWQDMRFLGTIVVIRDITERRRAERVSAMNEAHYKALLELGELRGLGMEEFVGAILERAAALTGSALGYVHLVDAEGGALELFRWSAVLNAQCRTAMRPERVPLSRAGIWADCVRTGEPAVHNYCAAAPDSEGLSAHHVEFTRHLSVPVLQEGVVRAVLGVGGKSAPYDDIDVRKLQRFAADSWQVVARRKAEAALRQSRELLTQTQAMARIGGWSANLDTRICDWTEETARLLGLGEAGLPDYRQGEDALYFLCPEDRPVIIEALTRAEEEGEGFDLEMRLVQAGIQRWVRIKAQRADSDTARQLSGMVQDITDRKNLELLRNDIDSIIRHDLKAPLNGIINLPKIMCGEANLTAEQTDLLRLIEESGRTMLRQIDMSLDLMKIERGQYRPEPHAFNLLPLVRDILFAAGDFARTRSLTFELLLDGSEAGPDDSLQVHGEERLCYPLLSNLIQNALEASPMDETVRIALERGEPVRVTIRNVGEIPPEIRPRFFEKYVTSGKITGTGLGTYSAQLFARTQGGAVELDTSEAGATTLVLLLPGS